MTAHNANDQSTLACVQQVRDWLTETYEKWSRMQSKSEILLVLLLLHLYKSFCTICTTRFVVQLKKHVTLVNFQLDEQNSYLFIYSTFIKIIYMFRALSCSSSGDYVVIVYMQPLVSSLSVGDCPVHRLRKNSFLTGTNPHHCSLSVTTPKSVSRHHSNVLLTVPYNELQSKATPDVKCVERMVQSTLPNTSTNTDFVWKPCCFTSHK
jgi:hypothetical protein